MNLTVKQLRVFSRLHKKHPVSLEFLDYNIERILKFMKYSLSLHFICRNKIIQRKFRIFIRYNVPKKNIYNLKSNQYLKKNQNKKYHNKIKKLQALPWTQRVVFYLKKKRLLEKIKQNNCCIEDETNFDLKSSTPTYTDENSLSNSQSIIEIDLTTPEKTKTNNKLQNSVEVNHPVTLNEGNITNFVKNQNDGKNFFCEKTGIFKKFSEFILEEEEKSVQDEVETNDETADTISNSDSEHPTSEIGYNILSSEQIEEQLKTQLELLKCGKRSLSLLSEKPSDNLNKSVQNPKEKNESNLKLSDLLNNKRLSGENFKLIEEVEELSEDTESADIAILKTSEIDNRLSDQLTENNFQKRKKSRETVTRAINECSTIDSFEISEKDAMEAGPSSKEFPIFANGNQEAKKEGNILKICNLSKNIINETNNYTKGSDFKPGELLSETKNVDSQKKSTNIVDSLISKLGSNLESNEKDEKEKEKITIKTVEQINNLTSNEMFVETKIPLKVHDDNSSSSDDFFGFSASEIIPPQIPGMLPTPAVPAFSNISAFISKDDKHSTIQSFPYKYLPRQCEDGLVRTGYQPPKFEMAALPEEMSKPRTLAEKRVIFSKQRNFKYFMIENENTIYHELKRRARDGRINTNFARSVQRSRVPASRDLWKATCWLLTENEKYYFQTIQIDGITYKILSGLGNFTFKNLPPQSTLPFIKKNLKRLDLCHDNCVDKKSWQTIRVRYKNPTMTHISQLKKLKLFKNECRPGPLCFKKKYYKDLEGCFNQLEIYKMPKIELEIYPKLNQPLDDYIKSYLKMILPSSSITKEWAEFAVSTLVEKANQYDDKNDEIKSDKGKVIKTKNSFKFTIPYLNDQTHILVRRVLTRSENFNNKENLTFRDVLKYTDDKISSECANVLSDMIDSVAIGLSENSFIQNDPDIYYTKSNSISLNPVKEVDSAAHPNNTLKEEENVEKEKDDSNLELEKKNNKKGRNPKAKLMMELKRLNATIINASDAKVSKNKVCEKEYCRLGCVCVSLGANYIPKKHCKKVKCMLEKCTCPLTLFEAGNSIITSEDAFILRQKATARLARMEREFTSTVVLTGNETLLINENQTKRKRRNNARLSNYYIKGGDDEETKSLHSVRSKNATPTNSNTALTSDNLPNAEELIENKSPVKVAQLPIDISNICYVNEDVMKSLKHSTVDLNRLENFDDKAIWCMVHCLYKCFCNGKDTEGKPYILKKQEEERIGEIYTRKAKYSFDKSEDESSLLEPPNKQIKIDDHLKNDTKNLVRNFSPFNEINLKEFKISKPQNETKEVTPEQKHKESRIISSYINNDFYGSHRVQPVPSVYKIRNKRQEIKNHWRKFTETEKTKLLLDERIRLSESYVRKVIVKRPPGNSQQLNSEVNNISNCNSYKNEIVINTTNTPANKNVPETHLANLTSNSSSKQMSLIKPEIRAKLKLTSPNVNPKQQEKQSPKLEQLPSVTFDLNSNASNSLFKISSVFSLNENKSISFSKDFGLEYEVNAIDENNRQEFEKSDINKGVLTSSLLQQSTNTSAQSNQFALAAEQVQKEVMKRLNYSVTKTMHNISKIQSDEHASIPNPQPDMMIAVQWKHFLQYYIKDKMHIWQVKVDKNIYFVGTMKHIMPYVVNAIGVINIKAIRKDNLPLFAQMLNAKFTNAQTLSLSILMEGHRDYWRILGMTKSNHVGARVGVIRPTTESHPKLTPKINKLFNILTQQYIESLKRRNGAVQNNTPTSITSLQHANKKIKIDEVGSRLNSNQMKKCEPKTNMLCSNPQTMVVINNYNLKNNEQLQKKNSGVAILNTVNTINTNKINIQKPKEFKMNIKIKKFTKQEAMAEHFQVPITSNTGDHRWLVLDLEDDFSHIIFGNSMESLSLNKIKLALQRSQVEKKMVRFPQVDGHLVDCYIMKFDKKRIYLGPFHESIDPVIILYQNVDGKTLVVREDYESLRGINRQKHTTGFWLCRKNGKIMFDMDPFGIDMNENILKQFNQQNMQQLHKTKNIVSLDSNKAVCKETPNSIIKLIPENMQLIQSQCNNLSVSNLNNKNNIYESNLEKIKPCAISSKNNTELPNIQQQIIHEVNKIIKTPCIITSIAESSSVIKTTKSNKVSNTSLKLFDNTTESANILKDPLIITTPTLVKEPEKKIILSKTANDAGIFSSNAQIKKNEAIVKSQKSSKVGDTLTTLATAEPTVGTINVLQSPIPSATTVSYPTTTSRPIVYGPHMQTPKRTSLPNNISSSKKKISPIQLRPSYSQNWSSVVSKNFESPPNAVRNPNPNLIKSANNESTGNSKIIGKYNQVIISKTTEKKGVENTQTELSHSSQNAKTSTDITNERNKSEFNGPVTAEVEEQGGQLILKLPEKFQHKFVSQQFIVSKNENGKLILEPSTNLLSSSVTETPKSVNSSAEKSCSPNEISQTNARKQLNQNLNVLKTLSTPGIITTSIPTSTIPVLSTVLSTDSKTKSKIGINNTNKTNNSPEKKILNPFFSMTQKSGIMTLKNKETVENLTNSGFPSIVSKAEQRCNTGMTNLTNFNEKGTISKPTLKQTFASFKQQLTSIITPKVEECFSKMLTKTSEEKSSNQEEQVTNESIKNTITTESTKNQPVTKISTSTTTITKSNQNTTEKINVIQEISKNNHEKSTPSLYSTELPQTNVIKKQLPTYPNALLSLPTSSKNKDIRKIFAAKKLSLSSTNNSKPNKDSANDIQVIYKIGNNYNKQSLNAAKKKGVTLSERLSSTSDFLVKGFIAGYFISNIKNYPKFGGFKKGNEFLIKTNLKSVLQLPSIAEVSKHLNSFIRKQSPQCLVDGKWQFIPFKGQSSTLTNNIKTKKIAQDSSKSPIKLENQTEKKKSSFNVSVEDKGVIVIDDDDDEGVEKSDNT